MQNTRASVANKNANNKKDDDDDDSDDECRVAESIIDSADQDIASADGNADADTQKEKQDDPDFDPKSHKSTDRRAYHHQKRDNPHVTYRFHPRIGKFNLELVIDGLTLRGVFELLMKRCSLKMFAV